MRRTLAEARAVYVAAGVDHVPDEEYAAYHRGIVTVQGSPTTLGSSWQSLARGSPRVEGDRLNGEIVLLGRLHGVPTPVNATLAEMAAAAARDGLPPGSMTEEQLLARIGAAERDGAGA
jgi:2-dehydropantoate 2-reductase